jgi:hypothetical protein
VLLLKQVIELETPPSIDPPSTVEVVAEEINEQMQGSGGNPQLIDKAIQQQEGIYTNCSKCLNKSTLNHYPHSSCKRLSSNSEEDKGSASGEAVQQVVQRKSPRQQTKNVADKTIIKKAQELIANMCGSWRNVKNWTTRPCNII